MRTGLTGRLLLKANVALLAVLLSGCPLPQYALLTDGSDPAHPNFCISWSKDCSGIEPINTIYFWRIGNEKEEDKIVWFLTRRKDGQGPTSLTYGETPDGFRTEEGPIPLEPNQCYEVNGYIFRCSGKKPNGVCQKCDPAYLFYSKRHKDGEPKGVYGASNSALKIPGPLRDDPTYY